MNLSPAVVPKVDKPKKYKKSPVIKSENKGLALIELDEMVGEN